jgi:hypothetical protein
MHITRLVVSTALLSSFLNRHHACQLWKADGSDIQCMASACESSSPI